MTTPPSDSSDRGTPIESTSAWLPLRLSPGDDLRAAIEHAVSASGSRAAYVVAAIGSLSVVCLRYAGRTAPATRTGDFELLTLCGSIAPAGAHLHASVADADGNVSGGHVARGCIIRTTAEVLVQRLPDWVFDRRHDAATGYPELEVMPCRA